MVGRRGSVTVSALVSERFGLEPWSGTLCCVLLKITVPLSILVGAGEFNAGCDPEID